MCLILFAYHVHPRYPLVVAANRDEFHQRKTEPAQWWNDVPHLLAGRDLVANGTWMGITRSGRFAAVTNVREPHVTSPAPCSRGLLTRRYLEAEIDDNRFASILHQTKDQYPGYNLLFGDSQRLHYYSNRIDSLTTLEPGIYGLSNARLDTDWPKVKHGKALLAGRLQESELNTDKLLEILGPTEVARDDQLPATGVSLEWERRLSAICIKSPSYGTRSSTVVLVDHHGEVTFHEKILAPENAGNFRDRFRLEKTTGGLK